MRILLLVAFSFFFAPLAQASMRGPYHWTTLQGLAQSSDLIATAHVVAPEERDPRAEMATGDRLVRQGWVTLSAARLRIDRVHVGDRRLAGREVAVAFRTGDLSFASLSGAVLVFLRRDGDRFFLPYFHRHGVIALLGERVAMWLEGRDIEDYAPVAEVIGYIRSLPAAEIRWEARVDPEPRITSGAVNVEFVARNSGREAVRVMPPSFHYDAVRAYRAEPGAGEPDRRGAGVLGWAFSAERSLVSVPPGGLHRFPYAIPFDQLGIDRPGNYAVYTHLHANLISSRVGFVVGDVVDSKQVWRGGMPDQRHPITVIP